MMYYGHGMGMGWILLVFAIALAALLFAGILVSRNLHAPAGSVAPDPAPDAERVLADRFARGEIDTDDYEQRLRTLRAARR